MSKQWDAIVTSAIKKHQDKLVRPPATTTTTPGAPKEVPTTQGGFMQFLFSSTSPYTPNIVAWPSRAAPLADTASDHFPFLIARARVMDNVDIALPNAP
jgi:hypothetical protein